jgi:hypothetical protein
MGLWEVEAPKFSLDSQLTDGDKVIKTVLKIRN